MEQSGPDTQFRLPNHQIEKFLFKIVHLWNTISHSQNLCLSMSEMMAIVPYLHCWHLIQLIYKAH